MRYPIEYLRNMNDRRFKTTAVHIPLPKICSHSNLLALSAYNLEKNKTIGEETRRNSCCDERLLICQVDER